jgi:diguanylate cyclase (GGDEF)-like protein
MSFRTRLAGFFVVIVVLPMVAVGVLFLRVISQSDQGKADARVNGLATAAGSLYQSSRAAAQGDAAKIARQVGSLTGAQLGARLTLLAHQAGLVRVTVTRGARTVADIGSNDAVAPGSATVAPRPKATRLITVSEITAPEYVRELAAPGVEIVVRQGPRTLGTSSPAAGRLALPTRGTVTLGGATYREVAIGLRGFGGRVRLSVLSTLAATSSAGTASRRLAVAFLAAFLLLALLFAALVSKQLTSQLSRFLAVARRLGAGDFSEPVPIDGHDEFAALGKEVNRMSSQLEHRIQELGQERERLRESIRRIGRTFASNLDRSELLKLALGAAADAVSADCGRVSTCSQPGEPLSEKARAGSLAGAGERMIEVERAALGNGGFAEATAGGLSIAAVALGQFKESPRVHGLITVGRRARFTDDDRDLLRSLATQATLALENVELHVQVSRQAVTDELTGLANHGRFQELLNLEIEQVRRHSHPLGLIMLDIDDFKAVNDTYGHQQGDVVLRHVARVVHENSREVDVPARYGGEEMALILPHTDLEGAYAIAERIRAAIADLRILRLDGHGELHVTASVGVASSADGRKAELITNADAALYAAKREGKNRTLKAGAQTTNVFGAE